MYTAEGINTSTCN